MTHGLKMCHCVCLCWCVFGMCMCVFVLYQNRITIPIIRIISRLIHFTSEVLPHTDQASRFPPLSIKPLNPLFNLIRWMSPASVPPSNNTGIFSRKRWGVEWIPLIGLVEGEMAGNLGQLLLAIAGDAWLTWAREATWWLSKRTWARALELKPALGFKCST